MKSLEKPLLFLKSKKFIACTSLNKQQPFFKIYFLDGYYLGYKYIKMILCFPE